MKFKPIASYKSGCKECLKIASQKGQPFRRTELGDRNSWYENGAYTEEINHLISHPPLNPTVFGVLVNSFSYLVYDYYNNGNGNLVSVEPVEEECESCDGEGEQECWSCNGEGEDWEGDECDECNGSGMVDCEPCYGMGEQDGGYEVTGIDSNRYENYIQPIYDLTNRSSAGRRVRDAMYRLEAALEKGVLNDGHNRERKPLYAPKKDKLYTDLGDAIGFYIINEPNSLTGGNNFINYMAEGFGAESFDAEDKRTLKKDSCCCGATKSVPCECMYLGNQCSARKPMCQCYKLLSVQTDGKKAEESFEANCGNRRDAESFEADFNDPKNEDRFEESLECSWCGDSYDKTMIYDSFTGRTIHRRCAESSNYDAETFEAEGDLCWFCMNRMIKDKWTKKNLKDEGYGITGDVIGTIRPNWYLGANREFRKPICAKHYEYYEGGEVKERGLLSKKAENWEEHLDVYEDGLCPQCHETWNIDAHWEGDWGYCPNCDVKLIDRESIKKKAETFEADWFAVKCVECEKPGYSDEMNMYNGMYLCARCANPDLDFSKYGAESQTFYEVMGINPMAKGGKRWVIENELGVPIGDFDSITAGKKAAIEDYAKKSKKTEGMMFWPPAFFGKGSHRKSNKGYTVQRNSAEGFLTPTPSKSILAIALIAGFLYGRRQ